MSEISVVNAGVTIDDYGKIGNCYKFDGNSSYLHFESPLEPNIDSTAFTICFWFKFNDVSENQAFFAQRTVMGNGIALFKIGDYLRFDTGMDSEKSLNVHYTFTLNKWMHICVTRDINEKKIYVDGNEIASTSNSGDMQRMAKDMSIGQSHYNLGLGYGGNYLNGCMNDFRVYSHCLSQKEIKLLSQALVLHYPMGNIDGVIGGRNLLTKSHCFGIYDNFGIPATITTLSETYNKQSIYRLSMSPTADRLSHFQTTLSSHGVKTKIRSTFFSNTTYTNSIYWRPVSNYDIRVGLTASNIGYWVDKKTESAGNGWNRTYATRIANEEKADWLYYSFCCPSAQVDVPLIIDFTSPKLEVNLSPTPWTPAPEDIPHFYDYTVYDTSGYGNHGTITESTAPTWISDSPRYSGSYSFKGQKYILTENLQTTGYKDSWTISWWSKISHMNDKMVWSFNVNNLNLYPDGSGNFCLNTLDGGTNPFKKNDSCVTYASYNDNKWHHYVVTGDGNTNLLYIDGVYAGASTIYHPITGNNLCLGKSNIISNNYYWDGEISDFRIYATVLSTPDIESLYNTAVSLTNDGTLLLSGEVIE